MCSSPTFPILVIQQPPGPKTPPLALHPTSHLGSVAKSPPFSLPSLDFMPSPPVSSDGGTAPRGSPSFQPSSRFRKHVVPCLLACVFPGRNLPLSWSLSFRIQCLFPLAAFKDFSLYHCFKQFDYDVPRYGISSCFSCLGFEELLGSVGFYGFHIWEVFGHYFFETFHPVYLLSFGDFYTHVLGLEVVQWRSILSFCRLFITMSSSSLTFFLGYPAAVNCF